MFEAICMCAAEMSQYQQNIIMYKHRKEKVLSGQQS